ncbi:hypothetical protein [Lactobacillus crispatus]|uniref:hypothetical protein n=1 Tax=Lactobacillus crispatus TaxID=47770 RepID=UPI001CC68604|nr:hypothetical protein [Lactobacillus crispatus]UAY40741.1 hypothetical protein LAE51_13725 [Lactobacillus crispatus]
MANNINLNKSTSEDNQQKSNSRARKQKFIWKIYNLTNYRSYHAFKKANFRLNVFFTSLVVIGFLACFMSGQFGAILRGLILALLIVYIMSYSWIMTKSRQLRKDSAYALQEMEFESGRYVSSWQLYDGIYNDSGWISLEIAFGRENSYISDIFKLIRKKGKIYPLPAADIKNLKTMIYNLNRMPEQKWLVYGTITDELAKKFIQNGFDLRLMENKYRTKPSRLDYAVATGNWKNALFKYPKNFSAYAFFVDTQQYLSEVKNEKAAKDKSKIISKS